MKKGFINGNQNLQHNGLLHHRSTLPANFDTISNNSGEKSAWMNGDDAIFQTQKF
jgi:hypothetical protein